MEKNTILFYNHNFNSSYVDFKAHSSLACRTHMPIYKSHATHHCFDLCAQYHVLLHNIHLFYFISLSLSLVILVMYTIFCCLHFDRILVAQLCSLLSLFVLIYEQRTIQCKQFLEYYFNGKFFGAITNIMNDLNQLQKFTSSLLPN